MYDDGAQLGVMSSRSMAVISCPQITAEEARAIYHTHRAVDSGGNYIDRTQITKIDPDQIPPPVLAKIVAHFDAFNAEKEEMTADGRVALVAWLAQTRGRPLDAREQSMPEMQLFRLVPPNRRSAARRVYHEAFKVRREAIAGPIGIPERISLSAGRLNSLTHTVPFPVVI